MSEPVVYVPEVSDRDLTTVHCQLAALLWGAPKLMVKPVFRRRRGRDSRERREAAK